MLQSLLYFCFVHFSLLVPGYVIITNTKLLKKNPGIELSLSYVATLVLLAGLATISYIFKFSEFVPQSVFWFLLLLTFAIFISQKLYLKLKKEWFPLLCLVLASGFSLVFIGLTFKGPQAFIPDPQPRPDANYKVLNVKVLNVAQTPANDNSIPYRQAQFFVNRSDPGKDSFIDEWGVHFFQRTPLMGAVSAQYFTALNDSLPIGYLWLDVSHDPDNTYMKFQIIAHVLNFLFLIPGFYLLSYLFSKKAAAMALLFMVPSQFFLYNAFFSWPKSLVAFFILLSWLLILEKRLRYLILAGIASGLAYLAHDLAVLYIGASFLVLLYQKRFRQSIIFAAICCLFALPWLLVSTVYYKKPSSFILYPLSINGIPQPQLKNEIIRRFFDTSPLKIIYIRLFNLFYLLSPYQLLTSEGGQEIGRRLWAFGLFSIPGAMGGGLILPALFGLWKKLKNIPLWIFILIPIVLSSVVIGWPKGLGALHFAEASVVLLVGAGCYFLSLLKRAIWTIVAYIFNSVQLIFFGVYSYNLQVSQWLQTPTDVLRVVVLLATIVGCGIGLYRLQSKNQVLATNH